MSNNNINSLAAKLDKITVGTPKTSAQRAAEKKEREEEAKVIAAERESANRKGSWVNAVKRATAASKAVVKKHSRRSLEGLTRNETRVNPKRTRRNKKKQSIRLKAAHNAMKNVKKTKRRSKANAEIVASAMPNTRKMGRTRRETAAIKKTAIVENDEE